MKYTRGHGLRVLGRERERDLQQDMLGTPRKQLRNLAWILLGSSRQKPAVTSWRSPFEFEDACLFVKVIFPLPCYFTGD